MIPPETIYAFYGVQDFQPPVWYFPPIKNTPMDRRLTEKILEANTFGVYETERQQVRTQIPSEYSFIPRSVRLFREIQTRGNVLRFTCKRCEPIKKWWVAPTGNSNLESILNCTRDELDDISWESWTVLYGDGPAMDNYLRELSSRNHVILTRAYDRI